MLKEIFSCEIGTHKIIHMLTRLVKDYKLLISFGRFNWARIDSDMSYVNFNQNRYLVYYSIMPLSLRLLGILLLESTFMGVTKSTIFHSI